MPLTSGGLENVTHGASLVRTAYQVPVIMLIQIACSWKTFRGGSNDIAELSGGTLRADSSSEHGELICTTRP